MLSDNIVIDVSNLSKRYEVYDQPHDRLKQFVLPGICQAMQSAGKVLGFSGNLRQRYFREFWALRDVSFQVKRGESFGIIGRNGSGKSTLLQILAGTLSPTHGEVSVQGRIAALLELGSGFNPEFTGRENVFLNGRILGLAQKEIEARYEQIVEFADIGEFIDQPVKTYSSGMFVRLAFAVQAHIDASIVIIDEALAVGDVFFRQKCYGRLEQLRNSGAAILLVSHSMPDIEQYCDRAILLDRGEVRFVGGSSEAAKHYYLLHQQPKILDSVSFESEVCEQEVSVKPLSSAKDSLCQSASAVLIDLSKRPQVSNGQAKCIGVALCNSTGEPSSSFRQGDSAIFYYEFELLEDVGVPLCGLLITNDKGVIVYGKNAWQDEGDILIPKGAPRRVICRHEIKLKLAPGEYTFELGLASVSRSDWGDRKNITHEEWTSRYSTICVVTNAGQLSISYALQNGVQVLTHHGVAGLDSKIVTEII